ncbi:hypothetical protein [Sorangium sp. So ce131]|uniref:hypothetical protein n=1 Tax=Sorangium sp. So ce131 TaxID=3133282 RepID=UPI003F625B7D
MRSIVIAYEDKYCEELHRFIKRLRNDNGLPGICLESRSVQGTGGFINDVAKLLRTPLKQTKLPPDRLVCLADADRPQNLAPDAPVAPSSDDNDALDRWVFELEKSWWDFLVREAHLHAESTARLRVICLRWNKESLLVASPDALVDYADKHKRRDQLQSLLDACNPRPTMLADADFILRYRKTDSCMDNVFQAIENRNYKKGRDDEDLLRDQISPNEARRAQVLKRCPDLERLLRELI